MNYSIDYYIDQLINHTDLFDSHINNYNPQKIFNFSNEIILITGAAGTIGKELFKQLLNCSYKKIVLVDIAESRLHDLFIEFQEKLTDAIIFKIANITSRTSIEYLFEFYKPTIVFHCAAYKHVPLMEANPYEAIKTNLSATKTLADISIDNKVKKFVFVSSDKAVNPVNIMGMTKYIAEQYLQLKAKELITEFIVTRFGNILGSNGSVLPVFLKQIELDLPLTITDKNMTRYFIAKEKSCQLILESTNINNNYFKTLSFITSSPIHIFDLAQHVVEISKKKNVKIDNSGVRSGEKLNETMVAKNEFLTPTNHPDIFIVESKKKSATKVTDFKSLKGISPYSSIQEIESILRVFL